MATRPSAEVTIIRNAPPPPTGETRGRKSPNTKPRSTYTRYPFAELRVGDAFDIPITSGYIARDDRYPEYNRVTATISGHHKRKPNGPRYMARMMDDYRVRVWRVA